MGGKGRYPIEGVTFIRADGYIILPLYFIYHSQKPKFEQLREAHINTCIRFLEQPMDDDMRGMDRTEDLDWFYKIASWDLNIDHDTPLKYLRMVNLQPPFYCSRVDLEIQVNVIQQ
jgi:hypothetical protein